MEWDYDKDDCTGDECIAYDFVREGHVIFQYKFLKGEILEKCRSVLEKNDVITQNELFFSGDNKPYDKKKESEIKIHTIAYYPPHKNKEESPPLPQVKVGLFRIGVLRGNKPLTWIIYDADNKENKLDSIRTHLGEKKLMDPNDAFLKEEIPWPKSEEKNTGLLEFINENKLYIGIPERKEKKEYNKIEVPQLPDGGGDLPTERPEVELPDKKLDQLHYETEDFDVSNELTPSDIYDLVVHNNIMSGIHVGALAHHIVTEKRSYDFDEQAVNSIILYRKDDTEITSELTYTERATSFIRSGFSKINASLSTPWVAGSMEAAKKEKTAHAEKQNTFYVTGKWKCPRVKLILPDDLFTPNDNFVEDIIYALDGDDEDKKFAELQKVFYKYGHFIPSQVTLGGELLTTKQEHVEGETDEHMEEGKIRAAVATEIGSFFSSNAGYEAKTYNEDGTVASSTYKSEQLFARGGNTLLANAPGLWLKSLGNFKNWRIISYDKIVPIYYFLKNAEGKTNGRDLVAEINEILNHHLQKEIKDIWGLSVAPHGDIYAVAGLNSQGIWKYDLDFQTWMHIHFPDIDLENNNQDFKHSFGYFSDIAVMKDGRFGLNHYFPPGFKKEINTNLTFYSPSLEDDNPLPGSYLERFDTNILLATYRLCLLPSHNGAAALMFKEKQKHWILLLFTDPLVYEKKSVENNSSQIRKSMSEETDSSVLHTIERSNKTFAFKKLLVSKDSKPIPTDGYPISIAAFSGDEMLVLVQENDGTTARCRKLLCLRNGKWTEVPNNEDILAIAADVDDSLIAVKADHHNHGSPDFPFEPSFPDIDSPRKDWVGHKLIRWYGWQSFIGKRTPPPSTWDKHDNTNEPGTGWGYLDPWKRRESLLE